jgi:hypothetical protein
MLICEAVVERFAVGLTRREAEDGLVNVLVREDNTDFFLACPYVACVLLP